MDVHEWRDHARVGRMISYQRARMPVPKVAVITEISQYGLTINDGGMVYHVGWNDWVRFRCDHCATELHDEIDMDRCASCRRDYGDTTEPTTASDRGDLSGTVRSKYLPKNPKACKACGAEFMPKWGGQVGCDDCREKQAVDRKLKKPRTFAERECESCGIVYTPKSGNQKKCDDCRSGKASADPEEHERARTGTDEARTTTEKVDYLKTPPGIARCPHCEKMETRIEEHKLLIRSQELEIESLRHPLTDEARTTTAGNAAAVHDEFNGLTIPTEAYPEDAEAWNERWVEPDHDKIIISGSDADKTHTLPEAAELAKDLYECLRRYDTIASRNIHEDYQTGIATITYVLKASKA